MSFVLANKWCYLLPVLLMQLLSGCSTVDYYMQAINGHFDITSREEPIDKLLADNKLQNDVKEKLELALQVREFASKELKLPDNDSYKSYADIKRPFVVWSVVAAPAFSVEPKQFCFLIVGCLSYRGYFEKEEAVKQATELKQQGYDVSIAGTTAYSTLGYFDDPLVSTMLRQGESSMIGIIFHELAHQQLHVDGDTAFNEAFATAVEQAGLYRWYQSRGEKDKYTAYIEKKKKQRIVFGFLQDTRKELAQIYRQDISDMNKQRGKEAAFERLRERYKTWQQQSQYHDFDNWMKKDLNNAHLALIATYQDLVPNFLALLKSLSGDMEKFYQQVDTLAARDKNERFINLTAFH